MDMEKLTERARGFVQAAQTIALREQNQQLETQHLLKALLDDREGLAAGLMRAAGADPVRAAQEADAAVQALPQPRRTLGEQLEADRRSRDQALQGEPGGGASDVHP